MDRSWMRANRLSAEYQHGVMEFLQFAEKNLPPKCNAEKNLRPPKSNAEKDLPPKSNLLFLCPCIFCGNSEPKLDKDEIKNHLICEGISQNYTQWIWHGEAVAMPSVSQRENVSVDTLCNHKDKPLYQGCTNFIRHAKTDVRSPSPPPRQAKWKRARQTKSGEYTSDATRVVAEKIDSLVEETEKGTFVPIGRDDILTNAIGTDEHGGRVRGEGRCATISNYFGRSSLSTQNINVAEQLSQLEVKLRADLLQKLSVDLQKLSVDLLQKLRADLEEKLVAHRQLMQQSLMETLKSIGFSQTASETKEVVEECSPKVIVKGSCSSVPANIKKDSDSDLDSVQKLLCMIVKRKTYLPVQLEHDACVSNFKMLPKYMKDLLVGDNWLDFSILQVWCTYMHHLSIETNNSDLYAFLDPCKLSFTTKSPAVQKAVKQYLQNKLRDLKKECYLAPYLWSGHWQLIIICPKDNIIVCLCSLHREINSTMKNIVTSAFMVHQAACGNRKKPTWIYPKTRLQPNSIDCGYYVMKNMIDIVLASITKRWMEVFNDPPELTEEDLYDLRNRWATCFLDLYNPEA